MVTIVRATTRLAALFWLPGLLLYGIISHWDGAQWVAAWGVGSVVTVALTVAALGGEVNPHGGGGPAVSGDEIRRDG